MRHPPAAFYGGLFRGALLALGVEMASSFPYYFAPGWANGWPGGLTIYQVWSTWLTATLFIMLMTSGIAIGSLICLLISALPEGDDTRDLRASFGSAFGSSYRPWHACGFSPRFMLPRGRCGPTAIRDESLTAETPGL